MRFLACLLCIPLVAQTPDQTDATAARTARMKTEFAAIPALPLHPTDLNVAALGEGFVSWVAQSGDGPLYVLQRGDKADPVLAMSRDGRVLRSWGKGLFTIPHSIRLDGDGNVWTVDAGSSTVLKFSPQGKQLLKISVELPQGDRPFRGTTDITFGCQGKIFVSDGYANNRVLEFDAGGKRLREWGTGGAGPGQFHLPHSITTDGRNTLYVADRQNDRIQRFDCAGKFLGEWRNIGSPFSMRFANGFLWVSSFAGPTGTVGWIHKVDPATGKTVGQFETVPHHGIEVTPKGEVIAPSRLRIISYR